MKYFAIYDNHCRSMIINEQKIYKCIFLFQTTLSKFRLILASNWKWIASFFVGASYIIFIVSLHAYNNQLIQNNSRFDFDLSSGDTLYLRHVHCSYVCIIFIVSLHSYNNQLIQKNSRFVYDISSAAMSIIKTGALFVCP